MLEQGYNTLSMEEINNPSQEENLQRAYQSFKGVSDGNVLSPSPKVQHDQGSQLLDTESEGRERILGMRGDSQDPTQNFNRLAAGVHLQPDHAPGQTDVASVSSYAMQETKKQRYSPRGSPRDLGENVDAQLLGPSDQP